MSELLAILTLSPAGTDVWAGSGYGPAEKRAFGGQFAAQSFLAAAHTVPPDADVSPTSFHLQFLRGGLAAPTHYEVEHTYDGRTAMTRRVLGRQEGRLLTTATVSFSRSMDGPEHGRVAKLIDPETVELTGPPGPAPGLPLGELDLRLVDSGEGDEFVRQLCWRTTIPLPDGPGAAVVHTAAALYVTYLYGIDPALKVHGHSMAARTHRSGTTDTSMWLHRPIRADRWNVLQSRSPAGARGRAVVTSTLLSADGEVCATIVQEGLVADRAT